MLAVVTLLLVSPVPLQTWRWTDATLQPVDMVPGWQPVSALMQADFDGDGRIERLSLLNGHATLQTDAQIRWQSPQTWQVRQAEVADLNGDGLPEAVLLVWRPFKSWPVDQWLPNGGRIDQFHNADGFSCQLILVGWYQNSFRERWAGSALAEPVKSFAVVDLSGNGKQLLVTLEASYEDAESLPARRLKVWEWNGFGFRVVYQMDGSFSQMVIARAGAGLILLSAP